MLVNPPSHLSHALSSMHRDGCMHETNREGRKNHLIVSLNHSHPRQWCQKFDRGVTSTRKSVFY